MYDFKSQSGQDKYLWEKYFKISKPGYYIDIGAYDGITGSNTWFFEQIGWHGICFEPMPSAYEALKENRKCGMMNVAILDREGEELFKSISGHSEQLSGIVSNYSEQHLDRISREMHEHPQEMTHIKVKCTTFNKAVKIKDIDILSIDTEGSESAILRSIDYDTFNISFIVAEFNYDDRPLMDFLSSVGFDPEIRLGVDIIFKNRNKGFVGY